MKPLAARMRPLSFDDLIGQDDIAREDSPLRKAAKEGNPLSAIFWGPPGSGKTTLALLLAKEYNLSCNAFREIINRYTGESTFLVRQP